jgi:hypothetical protein
VLPPKTHEKWRQVVTGKSKYQFEHLGLRILLTRIELQLMRDSSEDSVQKGITELHSFFQKFQAVTEADLKKIFP